MNGRRFLEQLAHVVDYPSWQDQADADEAAEENDALAEHRRTCLLGCARCVPFFDDSCDELAQSDAEQRWEASAP